MQFAFGTGNAYVIPPGATPTPIKLAALQDVSVDFDGDLKQLFGQNQFALDNARGKTKITGKIGSGQVRLDAYNSIFFNQTVVAGQTLEALGESGLVATGAVTVANSATWTRDLGVFNATTGKQLTRVAAAPVAATSYTVAAGVYTFNTTDNGTTYLFDYEYTAAGTGKTLAINNQLMGSIPTFEFHLNNNYKGQQTTLRLFSVVCPKLSLPFKLDDHMIASFDFSAQDNGAGQIGSWSTTET